MRLFVALQVPDEWRDAAWTYGESLEHSIEGLAPGVLRRVDRSLMHITLRFIGEVADEQVEAIRTALRAVSGSPFPASLALGAPGTFGATSRTSTVWVGVDGDLEGLLRLAVRIEEAVGAAALPPESRALRAHLTVARVRRGATPAQRRSVALAVREAARAGRRAVPSEAGGPRALATLTGRRAVQRARAVLGAPH